MRDGDVAGLIGIEKMMQASASPRAVLITVGFNRVLSSSSRILS